jgi:hypothetical protein
MMDFDPIANDFSHCSFPKNLRRDRLKRGLFALWEPACPASRPAVCAWSAVPQIQRYDMTASLSQCTIPVLEFYLSSTDSCIACRMDRDHSARHWHRPGGCQPTQTNEQSP